MPVYFGETVTVEVQGQTWREEKCQYCGGRFHYPLRITAKGVAINPYFLDSYGSPRRAEESARSRLDHALKHAVLSVPCPHCSKYQDYMVPVLRARGYRFMRSVAQFVLGLGVVGLAISLVITVAIIVPADKSGLNTTLAAVAFGAPVVPLAVALGLFLTRRRLQAAYDPNAEMYASDRRRLAADSVLTPEEFSRLKIPIPPTGLARLGRPPQRTQLVGASCVRCGGRIPDELDSRSCRGCGWPVHNRCAAPAEGGCPQCGAGAPGA